MPSTLSLPSMDGHRRPTTNAAAAAAVGPMQSAYFSNRHVTVSLQRPTKPPLAQHTDEIPDRIPGCVPRTVPGTWANSDSTYTENYR